MNLDMHPWLIAHRRQSIISQRMNYSWIPWLVARAKGAYQDLVAQEGESQEFLDVSEAQYSNNQ